MKNLSGVLIGVLVLFSFSFTLSAQSSEEYLDQVELLKQFVGTFSVEVGEDSVMYTKGVSIGDGVYLHGEWKTNGKSYYKAHAVIGFTQDRKTIVLNAVWSDGYTAQEIGRFVSPEKLVFERFLPANPNHAVGLSEYDFSNMDRIVWRWSGRGNALTWDPKWKYEMTYNRTSE